MKQGPTRIILFAAALSLWPLSSFAGQVYGTVFDANGPLGNVTVVIRCPGGIPEARRKTDSYGSYSVYVDGSGKCRISVNGASMSIRVHDDEARYDLRLQGNELKRK